jgi:Ca2+-binding RTX toxin-like protein
MRFPNTRQKRTLMRPYSRLGEQRLATRSFETLESRSLLSVAPFSWEFQGPRAVENASVQGMQTQQSPAIGAVTTIATHPENDQVVYVGTANGGVWRTSNARSASPHWSPLTDHVANQLASEGQNAFLPLSIGGIAIDPANPDRLVAGFAQMSDARAVAGDDVGSGVLPRDGGALYGLLWSENSGERWQHVSGDGSLVGRNITSVILDGSTMFVAADNRDVALDAYDAAPFYGGLLRGTLSSEQGGTSAWTFGPISGGTNPGPFGDITSLAYDRARNILFVAELPNNGSPGGVWRHANNDWRRIDSHLAALDAAINISTDNLQLTLGEHGELYVGVVNEGRLSTIARAGALTSATNVGWVLIDPPGSPFGIEPPPAGLHPGGEGRRHFSLAADPADAWTVYVAGDRQPTSGEEEAAASPAFPNSLGADGFVGRVFRGKIQSTVGSTGIVLWNSLSGEPNPASGIPSMRASAPHAGTRAMAFDSTGALIEADDGGVYRLALPALFHTSQGSAWASLNGDLSIAEISSARWDANFDRIVAGAQDIGFLRQAGTGDLDWRRAAFDFDDALPALDSTRVIAAIDGTNPADPTHRSTWYYSVQEKLSNFTRTRVDASGAVLAFEPVRPEVRTSFVDSVPLSYIEGQETLRDDIPIAIRRCTDVGALCSPAAHSIVIGTRFLYEGQIGVSAPLVVLNGVNVDTRGTPTNDLDDTYSPQNSIGVVTSIAMGDEPTLPTLFVGNDEGKIFHRPAGTPQSNTTWLQQGVQLPDGEAVRDIVLDPHSPGTAFAVTASHVYKRTAGSNLWLRIDHTLQRFASPAVTPGLDLRTIEFLSGSASDLASYDTLVVGGREGVFLTTNLGSADSAVDFLDAIWIDAGGAASPNSLNSLDSSTVALPAALVSDLQFTRDTIPLDSRTPAPREVLVAGTLGRGAWTVENADEMLTYSVRVGEILPADIERLLHATNYALVGATLLKENPAPSGQAIRQSLTVVETPVTHPNGGVDTVYAVNGPGSTGPITLMTGIPSSRAEVFDPDVATDQGGLFEFTGRLYLSPNHVETGWGSLDADPDSPGFQGTVELVFEFEDELNSQTRNLRVRVEVLPCLGVPRDMIDGLGEDAAERIELAESVRNARGAPLTQSERQVDRVLQGLNQAVATVQQTVSDAIGTLSNWGVPVSTSSIQDALDFDLNELTRTLYDPLVLRSARPPSGGSLAAPFHFLLRFDSDAPISFSIPAGTALTHDAISAAMNAAFGTELVTNSEPFDLDIEGRVPNYADVLEAFSAVPQSGGQGVGIRLRVATEARILTLTTLRAATPAPTPGNPLPNVRFSQDVQFDVTSTEVSGRHGEAPIVRAPVRVTLGRDSTSTNVTPEDLAADLNRAFAAASHGSGGNLAGDFYAFVKSGQLIVASINPRLTKVEFTTVAGGGTAAFGIPAGTYEEPSTASSATTTGFHGTQATVRPAFVHVVELMEHLAPILGIPQAADEDAIGVEGAVATWEYDNENRLLLFRLVVDPTADDDEEPDPDAPEPWIDTSFEAPIDEPYELIDEPFLHVEGRLEGTLRGHVAINVGIGIYLGSGPGQLVLTNETPLAELNNGDGIDIDIGVTGAGVVGSYDSAGRITGRLSEDNRLRFVLDRGLASERRVEMEILRGDARFADNVTVLELIDDVNDVLEDLGIDDLVEARLSLRDAEEHATWEPTQDAYLTFAGRGHLRRLEVENLFAKNLGFLEPTVTTGAPVDHHDMQVVVNGLVVNINLDGVATVGELIERFNRQAVREVDVGGALESRWIAQLAISDDALGFVVRSPPIPNADTPADMPLPIERPGSGIILEVPGSIERHGEAISVASQLGVAGVATSRCGDEHCAELGGHVADSFLGFSENIFFVEPQDGDIPTVRLFAEAVFPGETEEGTPIDLLTIAVGTTQFDVVMLDTTDAGIERDPAIFRLEMPVRLKDPGSGVRDDGRITLHEIFSGTYAFDEFFDVDIIGRQAITLGLEASLFGQPPQLLLVWQAGPDFGDLGDFDHDPSVTPPQIDLSVPSPAAPTPTASPVASPAASSPDGSTFLDRLSRIAPAVIAGAFTEGLAALRGSGLLNEKIPVVNKSINDLLGPTEDVLSAIESVLSGVDITALQRARDRVAAAIANLDLAAVGFVGRTDVNRAALAAIKARLREALVPINAYLAAGDPAQGLARLVAGAGQLRKEIARRAPATLHLAHPLASELRQALDALDQAVPTLNRLPERLTQAINEYLPAGIDVYVGLLDSDTATSEVDYALVVGLHVELADLLADPLSIAPGLPASERLGPIHIESDYGLYATATLDVTFGVPLDAPESPFLVISEPTGDVPDWVLPTSLELRAGFGGAVNARLQIGSLASDLVSARGAVALTHAESFDCIAPGCGVTTAAASVQLPLEPHGDTRLMIVTLGDGASARVLRYDEFSVVGQQLTIVDGTLLSTTKKSLSVRYLRNDSPFREPETFDPESPASQASVTAHFDPSGAPQNSLGGVAIAALGSSGGPTLRIDANGLLVAELDVSVLGQTADNAITLAVALDRLAEPQFVLDDAVLSNMFESVDFDLLTIVDGISTFLNLLEAGLTSEVVATLPIVGEGFDATGTFVGKLRATLVDPFREMLANVDGSAAQAKTAVRNYLYEALGPAGLGLIHANDVNGDGVADALDAIYIDITSSLFEIKFRIEGEDRVRLASFDTGLAGLPLSGTGGVDFRWQYAVDVGMGIDRLKGFYLLTNVPDGDNEPSSPEISLAINTGLVVQPSGGATSLSLDLFGLKATATDAVARAANRQTCSQSASGTAVCGNVQITLSDSLADERGVIYWSEIASAGLEDFAELAGDVGAKLNLDLDLGITPEFPSITAELSAEWNLDLASGDVTSSFFKFGNIAINAGEFLSNQLKPIVETVNEILEPIRPVIDLLTTPVPVLSQLYEIVEDRELTLLDLIAEFAPDEFDGVAKFVSVINQIDTVVERINEASRSGNVTIRFGDLEFAAPPSLDDAQWRVAASIGMQVSELAALADSVLEQLGSLANPKLAEALSMVTNEPKARGPGGLGIRLGIFDAENIFNFLLDRSADLVLVEWPLPVFEYRLGAEMRFPILPTPPVSLSVSAGLTSSARFSIGLDSRGFRTGNFLDGFYFGDRTEVTTGDDIDEFRFDLFAALGAALGVPGLSVGVRGELQADVAANWRDDDDNGKIYLDEILYTLANGGAECLFDLSGAMRAQLAVTWEVLFFSGRIPITDPIEIFTVDNFEACPVFRPAHVSEGGESLPDGTTSLPGTLIIHAGVFAALRGADASDVSESFAVTEIDDGIYDVEGMGLKQRFGDVERIFFDGGIGNDVLTTAREAGAGVEIGVRVVAYGGPGDDLLQGGAAHDFLDGGLGNDTLTGGGGNDTIHGGAGRDSIHGLEGNDLLYGNVGNDTIFGGGQNDTIYGRSGDDTLVGEGGLDSIYGESGHDLIDGGDGSDPLLWGGAGNDFVFGGAGLDSILGGWGNDILFAFLPNSGSDNALDYLEGGPDDDFICGSNGANTILGGTGEFGRTHESFSLPTPVVLPGGFYVAACGAMVQYTPTPTASIVGSAFFDADGDGVWETNEAPLAGVLIEVYDEYGDLVATAITGPVDVDNNGRIAGKHEIAAYRLMDLPPGTYTVAQTLLPNHQQSFPRATEAYVLNLSPGEARADVDFGSYRGGTIEGNKWNDVNGNRRRDPGEPPLQNVIVYLDTGTPGVLDEFDHRTTTDADGNYRFDGLLPGEYTVRESLDNFIDSVSRGFHLTYPRRDVVYESDFSLVPGAPWSVTTRSTASGNPFLGHFGNQAVTLQLGQLPAHESLTLEFDLYVFGGWEGNRTSGCTSDQPICQQDTFFVGINGGLEFARTTVSNMVHRQAYPETRGVGDFPPRSGALSNNSLAYLLDNQTVVDSIYRLRYTFAHTANAATFQFGATGIAFNAGWGLDNVRVVAGNDAHVVDLGPGETISGIDFGNRRTAHVQLSVVTAPTPVDLRGRPFDPQFGVRPVPSSIGEVDEWQPFWAEIWISSTEAARSLYEAQIDLTYNTAWTTARQVEFGPAFGQILPPIYVDAQGLVQRIHGRTGLANVGVDSPVLFARVNFAPEAREDFPSTWPAQSLGIGIDFARVAVSDDTTLRLVAEIPPGAPTLIRANPADLDDDRTIGNGDFALFEQAFGLSVAGASTSLAAVVDYDGSGVIDLGDFSILAARIGGAIPNFSPAPPQSASPDTVDEPPIALPTSPPPASAPPAPPTNAIAFTGFQFDDRNGDGVRGANESGIAGITVYIDLNRNGVRDPFEPSAVTTIDDPATTSNEAGEYVIQAVYVAGNYVVRSELPPGMQATNSAPRLTSISSTATMGFLHDIGASVANARETRVDQLNAAKDWIGIATNPLDGQLYGATSTGLYRLDPVTGAAVSVATFDVTLTEGDLAFHPITGGLYVISREDAGFTTLRRIDLQSGQTQVAAQFASNQLLDPSAMAFDPAGSLYAVDTFAPARLWRIDVDQATATLLFENLFLNYSPGRVAGMTFDPFAGQFLFAAGLWESGTPNPLPRLYRIHPMTGVVTNSISLPIDVAGLAWSEGSGIEVSAQFPGVTTAHLGAMSRYLVPDGSDTVHGTGGNDVVFGDNRITDPLALSEGDRDQLYGNAGNDTLDGQDKDDVLNGGDATIPALPQNAGDDDSLIGGPGIDEVRVQVDAPSIVLTNAQLTGQGRDTLSQIERASLTGGNNANSIDASAFSTGYGVVLSGLASNDTLIGSPGADELWGGQGSDNLQGRAGDDRYIFELAFNGGDIDAIDDTGGVDTLDFSRLPAGLPLRLNLNLSQMSVDAGRLIQSPMPQNLENVIGTPGPDWIIGSAVANVLDGGAGNDSLDGGAGANTLIGGAGDDTLGGGLNADVYRFGPAMAMETDWIAADTGGSDWLDFSQLDTPVDARLFNPVAPGSQVLATHANRVLLHNGSLVLENLVGGSGDDVLYSHPVGSLLRGRGGADVFEILSSSGDHTLDADATDTVSFRHLTSAVGVYLAGVPTQPQAIAVSNGRFVHLTGIAPRTVIGSNFADLITGNEADNTLEGGNGNDTLEGGLGNDVYRFRASTGSTETDRINEVNEPLSRDVLDFSPLPAHIGANVALNSASATHANRTIVLNAIDAIEAVYGGEGPDILNAGAKSAELYGNGGNDTLVGGGGNDRLVGGPGDDLYGFLAANSAGESDTIQELSGQGTDFLDFRFLAIGVTVDLTHATQVATHTNRSVVVDPPHSAIYFEGVTGGQGPDLITGNAADNTLVGNGGNDTIVGGSGRDAISGGTGVNTLAGGGNDDIYLFENLIGTHTLVEFGGSVNDGRVVPGGVDTLDFASLAQTVSFNLSATASQTLTSGPTITLSNGIAINGEHFENLYGSISAGNVLVGNAADNLLLGGNVNDQLSGGDGNDILFGRNGADTLGGGEGRDILVGGGQGDSLLGNGGDDILMGGNFSTVYPGGDDALLALAAIRAVWVDATSIYAARVAKISAGVAPDPRYRIALGQTALNDSVADMLTGHAGSDWFVTFLPDQVTDAQPSPPAGDVADALVYPGEQAHVPPAPVVDWSPTHQDAAAEQLVANGAEPLNQQGQAALVVEVSVVATPTSANSTTRPVSLAQVVAGQTYYVEIWVQAALQTPGVSGGFVDLTIGGSAVAVQVHHVGFDLLTDGKIDTAARSVDDLGGARFGAGHGAMPNWTRLAFVEVKALTSSGLTIELAPGKFPFAFYGQGNVPWESVLLSGISLPSVCTFETDLNKDGRVDRLDVATLARHFGTTTASGSTEGDINCDGSVDLADLVRIQATMRAFAAPASSVLAQAHDQAIVERSLVLGNRTIHRGTAVRRVDSFRGIALPEPHTASVESDRGPLRAARRGRLVAEIADGVFET